MYPLFLAVVVTLLCLSTFHHLIIYVLGAGKADEEKWVSHSLQLLPQMEKLTKEQCVSRAAFHASVASDPLDPPAISSLLPLFYEKAATLSMIKHGMDIQQQITSHLNPGQIPITTFDQPLFALAKTVQWRWPESHGEKKHVVMFGGLHIEMALWTTLGDLLDSSGWTTALCEAGIATSGTADSFLKASHLTRTRHSHQVTLLALSKLQHEAWEVMTAYDSVDPFDEWRESMAENVPLSNSGKLSVNLKFLSASSFEFIAPETSTYLWNPWKH